MLGRLSQVVQPRRELAGSLMRWGEGRSEFQGGFATSCRPLRRLWMQQRLHTRNPRRLAPLPSPTPVSLLPPPAAPRAAASSRGLATGAGASQQQPQQEQQPVSVVCTPHTHMASLERAASVLMMLVLCCARVARWRAAHSMPLSPALHVHRARPPTHTTTISPTCTTDAPATTHPQPPGPPKLVVFGGRGFVGSAVCKQALQTGLHVVSITPSGALTCGRVARLPHATTLTPTLTTDTNTDD
jgi:hypothetical protein